MSDFTVESQYKKYLQLVKLNEETMHPIQRVETKRAFYGAFGQLLMMLDELPDDQDACDKILQSLVDETKKFWNSQK